MIGHSVLLQEAQGLDGMEKLDRLHRVAMTSPEHLKAWLQETGRRWLVFDALELVDSLPFPEGVDSLIQLIACYRDHRRAIAAGRTEQQMDPTLGALVEVPAMKGEALELDELVRVVQFLIRQIVAQHPDWTIDSIAL
jgi:hypothetical protein